MAAAQLATRPAQFDKSTQYRRSMIAKIQIGVKTLAIEEDDYRQQLFDVSGQMSLAQLTERQMARVLDWLKSKGFQPVQAGRNAGADHPMARKARALWISLYHLGVVRNASEQAFEAFAKRQLKCERLVWARQSDAFRLIEALKAMAVTHGWAQANPRTHKPVPIVALQRTLCEAILVKLKAAKVAPDDWTMDRAAWTLCGIETGQSMGGYTAGDYERLAKGLGNALRKHAAAFQGDHA